MAKDRQGHEDKGEGRRLSAFEESVLMNEPTPPEKRLAHVYKVLECCEDCPWMHHVSGMGNYCEYEDDYNSRSDFLKSVDAYHEFGPECPLPLITEPKP